MYPDSVFDLLQQLEFHDRSNLPLEDRPPVASLPAAVLEFCYLERLVATYTTLGPVVACVTQAGYEALRARRRDEALASLPATKRKGTRRNNRRDAKALEKALAKDAEVYRLFGLGLTQAEIGRQLHISQSAVSKALRRYLDLADAAIRAANSNTSVKAQALPTCPRGGARV